MPVIDDTHTPQHQILINQSILLKLKTDMEEMKSDIKEIKFIINYIKKYTEKKEKRENEKWF